MLDKLTEDQRKVLLIWVFLGVFILILILVFAGKKIQDMKKDPVDKSYYIVKDYNRYYTVSNILDKYYTALSNKNYDAVYKMLSDDYKKNNDINESNVQTKIKIYDIRTTYQGALMCNKRLGKGHTSYYVSGSVVGTNQYKVFDDVYYEVMLDESTMTFTISEIDASTFGGACRG
jgi:hypothetical protein